MIFAELLIRNFNWISFHISLLSSQEFFLRFMPAIYLLFDFDYISCSHNTVWNFRCWGCYWRCKNNFLLRLPSSNVYNVTRRPCQYCAEIKCVETILLKTNKYWHWTYINSANNKRPCFHGVLIELCISGSEFSIYCSTICTYCWY